MLGRLLDRVPERWAERWARRLNLAYIVFMAAYLVAWWFLGLRVLAARKLDVGAAMFAGWAWVPVMFSWLLIQGIHMHHHFNHSRRVMADLDRMHDEMIKHSDRAHREIEAHRRQELGLPPADARPALH